MSSNPDQHPVCVDSPWPLFALVHWWITERGHVPDAVMRVYLRSLGHGQP